MSLLSGAIQDLSDATGDATGTFAVLTEAADYQGRPSLRLATIGGIARRAATEILPSCAELSVVLGVLDARSDSTTLMLQRFDGTALDTLWSGRPLPQSSALAVLRGIATALDGMHGLGFVHGTLRPESVVVNNDFRVRIVDWAVEWPRRTMRQAMALSPWAAPEVLLGEEVNARSDQFALAVMTYRLLNGEMPFSSDKSTESLLGRLTGVWQTEHGANVPGSDTFDVVFAPEPANRYPSCGIFLDALTSELSTVAAPAHIPAPVAPATSASAQPVPPPRWLLPAFWAACACAAVAFTFGVLSWNTQRALTTANTEIAAGSGQNLQGGKMRVCNPSSHAVSIQDLAVAYRDPQGHLQTFKSSPTGKPQWTVAPNSDQGLSSASWDGSVLFYFLHVEQEGKEYLLSGTWDSSAAKNCLSVASEQ